MPAQCEDRWIDDVACNMISEWHNFVNFVCAYINRHWVQSGNQMRSSPFGNLVTDFNKY